MEQIRISNRSAERVINRGQAIMYLPWPEVLGEYRTANERLGANAVDAILDKYVGEMLQPDPDVCVIGVQAGRDDQLRPVVLVTLGNRHTIESVAGQQQ